MIDHLDAIKAALAPLGYPVHLIQVSGSTSLPYLLLWSSSGRLAGATLDDVRNDIDDSVGVTAAGVTGESALRVAQRARAVLTPGGMGGLAVPGRRAWLRHYDSRPAFVDRDALIPGTSSYPVTAVDMYRLISTPA